MTAIEIKWPLNESHFDAHKRMYENLQECINEFQEYLNSRGLGTGDIGAIPLAIITSWFKQNALGITHKHEEIQSDA